jgi:TATA-box binding protein (TBP) (component of TFIID and TFIIIB)
MTSLSLNHFNQITKYLQALEDNPFLDELKAELENQKIQKLVYNFNNEYKQWIINLITSGIFSDRWIDCINKKFPEDSLLKYFSNYIQTKVDIGNIDRLKKFTTENFLNEISDNASLELGDIFKPSKLEYVTTTGIGDINALMDFKIIYNNLTIPTQIIESYTEDDDPIFYSDCIGKIIGCKYGDFPIKGYIKTKKSKKQKNFYNCGTFIVCLSKYKTANVKIFNNGQLQLTGVPSPNDGRTSMELVLNFLKSIPNSAIMKDSTPDTAGNYSIQNYNTVMINTYFNYNFNINREVLYEILLKRYKLCAVFDSEYPGVRIYYYYHEKTVNTSFESTCKCSTKCKGEGNGFGSNNCRKLSIAIFQSGKAIIAGGCSDIKPIQCAYDFINKILKQIVLEIKKNPAPVQEKKIKKKPRKIVYISKSKFINDDTYTKLLTIDV